jgi:hypothetical protein
VDDVDNIAKNGGNLSFRAMGEQIYFDFFKNGNNFLSTGEKDNNLYGTGIYVLTVFDTPVTAQKAEDAHKILTKRGYSNPGYPAKKSATARMATSADFKWGDQEKTVKMWRNLNPILRHGLHKKKTTRKQNILPLFSYSVLFLSSNFAHQQTLVNFLARDPLFRQNSTII